MFEKLIEVLAALVAALTAQIVAIKENTAALSGAASAPAESGGKRGGKKGGDTAAPTTPTTTAPAPSVDEVRKAASSLIDVDQNAASALLSKLNAKHKTAKISEVPESARAEVIAELTSEAEKVKASKNAASQI